MAAKGWIITMKQLKIITTGLMLDGAEDIPLLSSGLFGEDAKNIWLLKCVCIETYSFFQ